MALLALMPGVPSTATPAVAIAPHLAAATTWLDELNLWRSNAGLSALTENTTWSAGDYDHALYMVKNDLVTHYETPGVPYYTVAGDQAARNGNIEVNSTTSFSDVQAIDWWMGAPFHAMGMMDPRLASTGFGAYREVKSGWQAGFALDVIRGNSFTGGAYPVYWPGNGSTEPLTQYSGNEFPDPLQACPGYSVPTGLPVFIEIGGNVKTTVTASSFSTGATQLPHCVIDGNNSALSSYLYTRGGAILIPQQPLQAGTTYTVAMTVNNLPYAWSFTVGPLAPPPPPPGWKSLGGELNSTPAASSWGASRVDVFTRGNDNALHQTTWNGSVWSADSSLGGRLTSAAAAVSWGPNRIDVFVRGTDNALYHKWWTGTWSAWESLGGTLTSAPSVTSWASGRLDVFVRGTDDALYHKWWTGSSWAGWERLGGTLSSDPGGVSSAVDRITVLVRGTDNGLYQKSWTGTAWTAWSGLGGVLTSAPAAASCASGHVDVFVRGTDYAIYQLGFNGSSWVPWKLVGGWWTTGPASVCPPGSATIQLFERGLDGALWTGPGVPT